jgi:flagellar protein FliL
MAEGALPVKAAGSETPKKGSGRWLLALVVLTLLAVVTGGLFGLSVVSKVEKAFEEKKKSEEEKVVKSPTYSGNLVLKEVPTVLTNLKGSGEVWVRLEASIVFMDGALQNPNALVAEIRQDMLAYVRTLSVEQLAGASGLQHLREDLNERATLRSQGAVRELIIETLVVQ